MLKETFILYQGVCTWNNATQNIYFSIYFVVSHGVDDLTVSCAEMS